MFYFSLLVFLLTGNLKHEGQHDLQHMVDGCHFIQFFCCCSYCACSPFHTVAKIFERQQSPVDTKTTTCSCQGVIQVKYHSAKRFISCPNSKISSSKTIKIQEAHFCQNLSRVICPFVSLKRLLDHFFEHCFFRSYH